MKKLMKSLIVVIYLVGICCVAFLTMGYLQFSDYVVNPDAMLPIPAYEGDVLLLLIGSPVMLMACVAVVMTFRRMKTGFKVAVFLPFAVCLAVVGHYLTIGDHPVEVDTKQFTVEITLDTDEPVYAIGMDLLLDGEAISGQACCNARSDIPLKGTNLFNVIPEDVPQGRELRDLTLVFQLYNEPTEEEGAGGVKIENGTVSCTEWEETVCMTVTGNEKTGYIASVP